MEGVARSGEGQGSARACAARTLGLFSACLLVVLVGSCALAAPALSTPALERQCAQPPALSAACTAIRLLSAADGTARHATRPAAASEPEGAPEVEVTSPAAGFLTPQDLHAAYSLPTETKAASTQTVALINAFDDPTAESDLAVYDEQFGLPPCTTANGCFRKVNGEGKSAPLPPAQGEWAGEISIDVQMAHAICQNCHILLVEADDGELTELSHAVTTATAAGANEISNSYESPEEPEMASFFEEIGLPYKHAGVVITAAAGDCGYLNQACPSKLAMTNFPADVPDVIGVGGTTLTQSEAAWTSTAWDEGGSGCSQIFAAPAWQRALATFAATGCGTERSVADVAAVGDPKTGVDVFDSTPEGNGAPTGWAVFGGTSVSAPIVAAEFALAGGAQGAAHPVATLYSNARGAGDFFDVVSGANGSCAGASICQATLGYDGPTGLGSPLGLGAFLPAVAPKITGISPTSGITGETVTIAGSGLGAVDGVDFGKLAASFDVVSSTRVEATVPDGDVKSKVTVVTPAGEATSKAKFAPTLSVVAFTPTHGAPGTVVTITGVGFDKHSAVSFDGTPARLQSASARKLKALVPAGSSAGPIAVTNTSAPAGTVQSAGSFSP